jgi:hypothetical protein
MDDGEVERLRKAIRYSFCNSPHKKRYWLALLEMHVEAEKRRAEGGAVSAVEGGAQSPASKAPPGIPGCIQQTREGG